MSNKHLRVTCDKETANKIWPLFVKKFNPTVYIFGFETKGDNHHFHGHLEYEIEPKKSTVCDWFKSQNLSGKYYHKELDKDPINNKLYVVKDLDILGHNLSDDELEYLKERTEEIDLDKSKDIKVKLYERIKKRLLTYDEFGHCDMVPTSHGIAMAVTEIYVDEWDKLPPPFGLHQQYVLYLLKKLYSDKDLKDIEGRDIMYQQIHNFHNKFHIMTYEEEKSDRDKVQDLLKLLIKRK